MIYPTLALSTPHSVNLSKPLKRLWPTTELMLSGMRDRACAGSDMRKMMEKKCAIVSDSFMSKVGEEKCLMQPFSGMFQPHYRKLQRLLPRMMNAISELSMPLDTCYRHDPLVVSPICS